MENGLDWPQVLGGNIYSGIAASFLVRAIPATFLIGPDGRILARNLKGPALHEAVRNALKDEKLFADAKLAIRPPRFAVTRFGAEPKDKIPVDAPQSSFWTTVMRIFKKPGRITTACGF